MSETAPAITTRTLDLVLTGGLSALAMGLLLAWAVAFDGSLEFVNGDWIALLILVNAPHFMASYRLLYVSREQIATVLKALVSATFRVAVPAFA